MKDRVQLYKNIDFLLKCIRCKSTRESHSSRATLNFLETLYGSGPTLKVVCGQMLAYVFQRFPTCIWSWRRLTTSASRCRRPCCSRPSMLPSTRRPTRANLPASPPILSTCSMALAYSSSSTGLLLCIYCLYRLRRRSRTAIVVVLWPQSTCGIGCPIHWGKDAVAG